MRYWWLLFVVIYASFIAAMLWIMRFLERVHSAIPMVVFAMVATSAIVLVFGKLIICDRTMNTKEA